MNQVDSDFWAKNLPDNGEKICVAFDVSASYTLNNFNCYSSYGFFCEYDMSSAGNGCKSDLGQYENTCFQLVDAETSLNTWYGADKYCQSKGFKLMTVKTVDKLNAVQVYLKSNARSASTKAWVDFGLFIYVFFFFSFVCKSVVVIQVGGAKIIMDEFEWKSGRDSQIDPSLWADSERNKDNRNCVAMDGLKGNKLVSFDCNMNNEFFCEYS